MSLQLSESRNLIERVLEHAPGHAERAHLLLDPAADLVEDAVVVERLRDQGAAWHELDHRAQHVGGVAIDGAHVDRVDAEDDGQHPEAGDEVRLVGEVVERVADAEPLDRLGVDRVR